MKIYLSPARIDQQLTASVSGDILTVNGSMLDFTPLLEGETLPFESVNNNWVVGDVHRIAGEINLVLMLPYGANAPESTRFPAAYKVPMHVVAGEVPLPAYDEGDVDE